MFSHKFLNKLSVIIGSCDLLLEAQPPSAGPDAQTARRLEVIRSVAREMASDLSEHQRELDGQGKVLLLGRSGGKIMVTTLAGAALEIGVHAVDGQRDPLEADGEGDPILVGRGRVARAHKRDRTGHGPAATS